MPSITIEIPIKEIWLNDDDFDGYDTIEFEYEYDEKVLHKVLIEFFADNYSISLETATKIANDFELYDYLLDDYDNGSLLERLQEELYDEALEYYNNNYRK